ncbi:MAG: ABC transporter permease, partial [Achromobacter sp.]|uniref:ABC transporter permease n=1 Tax=Achromobacter sp. TaxID=134375 RepID=UPI0025868F38
MKTLIKRYFSNAGAVVGLACLAAIVLMALSAQWLYPVNPWDTTEAPFLRPFEEASAWLGADSMGRNIAAGIVHGAQASLLVGVVATVVAVFIGMLVGVPAGYLGGRWDELLMRLTEIFQTIPSFLFAIVLVAIFQPSFGSVITAVALVSWPPIARLVRAEFMRVKSAEFVEAATVQGYSRVH